MDGGEIKQSRKRQSTDFAERRLDTVEPCQLITTKSHESNHHQELWRPEELSVIEVPDLNQDLATF